MIRSRELVNIILTILEEKLGTSLSFMAAREEIQVEIEEAIAQYIAKKLGN
jgi:hypothetical protein